MAEIIHKISTHLPHFRHLRCFSRTLTNECHHPFFMQSYDTRGHQKPNQSCFQQVHKLTSHPQYQSYRLAHQWISMNTLKFRNCQKYDSFSTVSSKHFHSSEISNESILKDVVCSVVEATRKMDVMVDSLPRSHVEHLVISLLELGFDDDSIRMLLSGKLWLLQQADSTLAVCQLLLEHGMTPDLVCDMFYNLPYLHRKEIDVIPARVNQALLFLRIFGFTETEIHFLLSEDSSVLYIDENSLQNAVSKIKALFPSLETKRVVCMSPNVLYEDWSSIRTKFDYCLFAMGYIQSDIVRSRLLSHSLNHIQDRHMFLQRSGLFKTINKKLDPSLNPNPRLKQVVDLSDSSFVKFVEGVSVQEYHVFRRMMQIERETESTDFDYEDDDEGDNSNSNSHDTSASKSTHLFNNKNLKQKTKFLVTRY